MHACLNKDVCDCSAAQRALWQDLELIFRRLLQHGNRRARRERVAYASPDPQKRSCVRTHGSCMFLCMKMCEKSSGDCWRHSKVCTTRHAAPFRVIHTCKTLCDCALSTYTQTLSVNFVHGNGNTHACRIR